MRDDRPEQLPLARTDQLIVKEVDDEVLVYDLKTDQAHCLNDTAALVWKNCDGKNSVSEIQASLANEAGAPVDEGVVWLALDQLEKFKLLAEAPTLPTIFAGMGRRQLIRTLGLVAVTLPVIISIATPTAQAQGFCGLTGAACGPGKPACCAGHTCPSSPPKNCT